MTFDILSFLIGLAWGYAATRVWDRYFGSEKGRPRTRRCAHEWCGAKADPRCAGGNCSEHCASHLFGCGGACIELWEAAVKRGEVQLPGADGRTDVDLSFLK